MAFWTQPPSQVMADHQLLKEWLDERYFSGAPIMPGYRIVERWEDGTIYGVAYSATESAP
jgi:hypothetical protein